MLVNPTVTAFPLRSTSVSGALPSTSTFSGLGFIAPTLSPSTSNALSSLTSSAAASSVSQSIAFITSSLLSPTQITCSSGFRSCASSVGGGCCPTDRACGPISCSASGQGLSYLSTTSDNSFNIAVRPTSDAAATATSVAATSLPGDICPTGFYQCSAYYNHGGCCRVGRDCSLTSCPTIASTVVTDTNDVRIVAPTVSGTGLADQSLGTGSCAQGWFTCAASNGGGCCPTGYACGSSCTATANEISATASVEAKSRTSEGFDLAAGKWHVEFPIFWGIVMVYVMAL